MSLPQSGVPARSATYVLPTRKLHCSAYPLFCFAVLMKNVFSNLEGGQQDAYARAGEVVSEALALFRTVTAFGGQAAEVKR